MRIQIINQSESVCSTLCNFFHVEGHQAACNFAGRKSDCRSTHPGSGRSMVSDSFLPDLIIIEVSMPETTAIETVKQLQRATSTRNIPIIVISEHREIEYEFPHTFDFICTPIDLGRLREDVAILQAGARSRDAAIKPQPLTHDEHLKFHDFLILHSGLHFERRNIKVLERGLTSRMNALHIGSFDDYFAYLTANWERRQELQKLLQHLTVGETFFFRYHAHFDALGRHVLPALAATGRPKSIRIWSAGCSTGEEPYSLAMTVMENLYRWQSMDIRIVATDINSRSLRQARDGVYNDWKVRATEDRYLQKYFNHIGDSYLVNDGVKALVDFSYFNLQAPPQPPRPEYDVIFCRNVMIYFTTATTKKIVDYFAASLKPGGYLFLGHSETLANISSKFERHIHDGSFYYRKKEEVEPAAPARPAPAIVPPKPKPVGVKAPAAPVPVQPDPEELFRQAGRMLHEEKILAAADLFGKILQANPEHAGAILGIGQVQLMSGRLAEALASCDRALAINDLLPEGYFQRGLLYELQEKVAEAFGEYNKAVLLQMDFVMPHYQMGKLHYLAGDIKASLREFKNCVRLLEKTDREALIPYSGGLSREVLLQQLRRELAMIESAVNS